jgi:hypothetical protein
MQEWFKTLTKKQLATWIRAQSTGINTILNSEEDWKNIELAKEILKEKTC